MKHRFRSFSIACYSNNAWLYFAQNREDIYSNGMNIYYRSVWIYIRNTRGHSQWSEIMVLIRIHQVLRVLEICGTFTSTWPPKSTAGKREIFLRDLGWTLATLNVLSSLPPLILGAWYSENDIIRMMKALSELTALMEVLFNLILCRIGRSRLQVWSSYLKY